MLPDSEKGKGALEKGKKVKGKRKKEKRLLCFKNSFASQGLFFPIHVFLFTFSFFRFPSSPFSKKEMGFIFFIKTNAPQGSIFPFSFFRFPSYPFTKKEIGFFSIKRTQALQASIFPFSFFLFPFPTALRTPFTIHHSPFTR